MSRKRKIEFGDFQTPYELAYEVTQLLKSTGVSPSAVIEPTCGMGSFLKSSMKTFNGKVQFSGFDINPDYVAELKSSLSSGLNGKCDIKIQNFFEMNWPTYFKSLPDNLLIVGNPPWVTNSGLGALRSNNLPKKNNFQKLGGFASKTGKANFDISEWMLIKLLESLRNKKSCLAMLCKTAIARKTLKHAWLNDFGLNNSSIHLFDAKKHFGVSVDACLFITHTGGKASSQTADIYPGLHFKKRQSKLGIVGKELVADVNSYRRYRDFDGLEYYKWRSGVKHDAVKVMEFKKEDGVYINGFNEKCDLESEFLFPLLKSSDIANGRLTPNKYVLLTQKGVSDDTGIIRKKAPKTWRYLLKHAALLDKRKSIIYDKRPRFSIFGIGSYTFAPWKVAISGLYKNISFVEIGKYKRKPVVVDDTCYFIPCNSEKETSFITNLLNSKAAKGFIDSLIFLDAKRPVTIDILKRIDLKKLAEKSGKEKEAKSYLENSGLSDSNQKVLVFEKTPKYKRKHA